MNNPWCGDCVNAYDHMTDLKSPCYSCKEKRNFKPANKQLADVSTVDWSARAKSAKVALRLILDCVDYTAGACGLTEMVGGVLPLEIINKAKAALKDGEA